MTLSRALVSHSGQFLTADTSLLVFQDESLLDYTGLGTFDGTSGTVGFSFSTLRLSAELTHGAGRTLDLSSALLEGPATLVNLGRLKMGNPGTLNTAVRNQGTAELDFGAALNAAFDNLGSLKLGGRLTLDPVNGQMINHGTVTLAQRNASASVIATGGQFRNEPGSIFRGANTFDAATSVVTFEGGVEPGGSASFVGGINPGTLALTGPLPLTETSRVLIEIAGRGDFADRIAASGPATLSGALEIRLLNNFKPNLGDRFTIVSSNARTGEFSTVAGLAIDATRRFEVRYSASEVTLEVVAAP